ncbi:hypothetical protein ABT061_02940 [Streptosporangium sp. NPDC002544]|uniref:hypothetical protein n=1 Tax=unclassified Streptosporangium TaxID=2632669 RepID=UPI00332CE207
MVRARKVDVTDEAELDAALNEADMVSAGLSLFPYMTIEITQPATHPSDIRVD